MISLLAQRCHCPSWACRGRRERPITEGGETLSSLFTFRHVQGGVERFVCTCTALDATGTRFRRQSPYTPPERGRIESPGADMNGSKSRTNVPEIPKQKTLDGLELDCVEGVSLFNSPHFCGQSTDNWDMDWQSPRELLVIITSALPNKDQDDTFYSRGTRTTLSPPSLPDTLSRVEGLESKREGQQCTFGSFLRRWEISARRSAVSISAPSSGTIF